MARPQVEINKEHFENLCNLQCTLNEIAGFFKCSPDTIENWCKRTYQIGFSDTYKKYSQNGKISLRRHQFKLAEKNASMAIWLGKQYLGQTDVGIVTSTGDEILKNLTTVAQLINNPVKNRDITDLE
jgi:hypothetical protein